MRLESGCLRQLGQLGTTFSRCAAQPGCERKMDGKAGGSPTERPFSKDWKSSARFPAIGKRVGKRKGVIGASPLVPPFQLQGYPARKQGKNIGMSQRFSVGVCVSSRMEGPREALAGSFRDSSGPGPRRQRNGCCSTRSRLPGTARGPCGSNGFPGRFSQAIAWHPVSRKSFRSLARHTRNPPPCAGGKAAGRKQRCPKPPLWRGA